MSAQGPGGTPGPDETPRPEDAAPARPAQPPRPGDTAPTTRRLERPPSDRYRQEAFGSSGLATQAWRGSPFYALWGGVAAGLAGATIFTVAAGGLGFDWGLVVIAVFIGWSVAEGVRVGAGPSLTTSGRRGLVAVLTVLALSAAEVGTWLWARQQGGDLPPLEHLWTTYGPMLPLQYVAGLVAALWSAR